MPLENTRCVMVGGGGRYRGRQGTCLSCMTSSPPAIWMYFNLTPFSKLRGDPFCSTLHSPPPPPPPRQVYLNLAGDIEPPEFRDNPGSTLHLWSAKDDTFMSFTAHRNPDDTYSGTFRCGMMMLCVWKCGTHTGWRNVCVVCVEVWMSYMGPLPSALLCCTPQPCTAGLAPPHACMHAPWSTPHHARYSMHSVTSFPPFPPT